jgi:hypothetical protein
MVFSEIVRDSLVVIPQESLTISLITIHWLQRSYEWVIATKVFLSISLKTIHWVQRTCERGIATKECEIVRDSLVVIPHSQLL